MDLEQAKNIIKRIEGTRKYKRYVKHGRKAERYYEGENDIKRHNRKRNKADVFKIADHRISCNFFKVLLDQKASYLFGNPPVIDVGNPDVNQRINDILGYQWGKNLKHACVIASEWGNAWIQYWIDANGEFQYGVLESPEDVMSEWGGTLNEELVQTVKRVQDWLDPETGDYWTLYEIWTSDSCYFYRFPSKGSVDELEEEFRPVSFGADLSQFTEENSIENIYEEIPFIECRNNAHRVSDLKGLKELIDAYDETLSSLFNDIQDCEETIFVLEGYGDQDPTEFWSKVSENRLIKLVNDPIDNAEGQGKSGVQLLSIEPPVAAAQLGLELGRKAIFELGGGVDPTPEVLGNTSGEALKHMYNLLELKSIALEDEFRIAIARLVKAICKYLGYTIPDGQSIIQTWKRSRINNDTELINNVKNSVGILSTDTLLSHHPFVDNPDEEKEKIEEEQREYEQRAEERAINDFIQEMSNNAGFTEDQEA